MKITVRLYRQHDMDLILLYMDKSFKFATEMKKALIGYVSGNKYSPTVNDIPPDFKGYLRTSVMVHLCIDEKQHPDVIKLLNTAKQGQRNALIKAIMRESVNNIPLSAYFTGDGIIMSKSKAESAESEGENSRSAKAPRQNISEAVEQPPQKMATPKPVKPQPQIQIVEEPQNTSDNNILNPLAKMQRSYMEQINENNNEDSSEDSSEDTGDLLEMMKRLSH